MEKVKSFMAVVVKHHFWVLSVVVLLMSVGAWYAGASSISEQYDKEKSALNNVFTGVQTVVNKQPLPNGSFADAVKEVDGQLRGKTLQAWEKLYAEQKDVFYWSQKLGPEFVRGVEQIDSSDDPEAEFSGRMLRTYQDYIRRVLPEMWEIVDIRTIKPPEAVSPTGAASGFDSGYGGAYGGGQYGGGDYGGGGYGGGGYGGAAARGGTSTGYLSPDAQQMGPKKEGVVIWDTRDVMLADYRWPSTPETIEVRLAQEDLWVYTVLLEVIRRTNGPEANAYNAAVKQIISLQIGKKVAPSPQNVITVAGAGAEAGGTPFGGGGGGYGDGGYGGSGGADGAKLGRGGPGRGGPGGGPEAMLLDRRYVDAEGEPVVGDQPFSEFKMMPIRFELLMNQNQVVKLVGECANSPVPVEVTQVRFNPTMSAGGGFGGGGFSDGGYGDGGYGGGDFGGSGGGYGDGGFGDGGSGGGFGDGGFGDGGGDDFADPLAQGGGDGGGFGDGGFGGGGYGGGGYGGGGYGGGGYGGGGGGYGGGSTSGISVLKGGQPEPGPYDVKVVVRGRIYIFNRPDRELLGTGARARSDAAVDDAAVEPSQDGADADADVMPDDGTQTDDGTHGPATDGDRPATGPGSGTETGGGRGDGQGDGGGNRGGGGSRPGGNSAPDGGS